MKKILAIAFLFTAMQSNAQDWSKKLAETAMTIWKDSFMMEGDKTPKWRYDQGVILKGIEGIWTATGDARYFNYIQKNMDYYVKNDGTIKGYKREDFNIDNLNNGRMLLMLYRVTGKEKYRQAAALLRSQLKDHPRTSEGGFWHKKVYPNQMWLDGLYMGEPFYAEYAMVFHDDAAFNDITRQFVLMEQHARDPKSGLLYHGWDESREQKWADKNTGRSPNVWGRALGWYGTAMVDALDYFPAKHPGRDSIITILNRFAKAVASVQDSKTGLWYDVADKPKETRNYLEASASSMLVYTLAKAVRMGYIPASYLNNAKRGYNGVVKQFIKTENGQTNLHGTVSVSGLGGTPYRDGSFDYYMSEPVVVNDPKGMGAFINAAVEMEMVPKQTAGKGKTVLLDYFFNNEWKKDSLAGFNYRYHYTWDDRSNSGFSILGNIFRSYGVKTATLESAPDANNLRGASIYLIVDPDTEKETAHPNYITPAHVTTVKNWVKAGGVLVLLTNDAGNADLEHTNLLSKAFGVTFNEDSKNKVEGNKFEQGAVIVPQGHSIFTNAVKLYIKELSSLNVQDPAVTVLKNGDVNVMAVARYGKGTVFMLGDPWVYNEYVDGRKLPADFDNYKAATDLVQWLIKQVPAKK